MTTLTPARHARAGAPTARPPRSPHRARKAGPLVSVQAIRWARRQRTGSPVSKAVLYVLADHHNSGSGLCCPSTRTIAEEADTDQRTARRHLEALRDRGLLSWSGGYGRGRNRYVLPLDGEGSDPSQVDAGNEGQDPSLDLDDMRGETPHNENRSEAQQDRSEALILRSEANRASDLQEQKSKRTTYRSEEHKGTATPPPAQARTRGGERPREHASPAELNATAASGAAYGLVAAWVERNPGVANGHRRELSKAVDLLLAQGADRAHIPAALDGAHASHWRNPVKALPMAYEDVRRAAAAPTSSARAARNTTDDNIRALLASSERPTTARRAIGGPR
nr:helix-turn-helix domain-containing protein [Pseudonocardia broussonetiae]